MSANVWFEQLNNGLIDELKNTVRVVGSNGAFVPLPDTSFVVRKPEEDFKIEVFPCVSTYVRDYKPNIERYNPAPVVVGTDEETHMITLEDPAISFDISIQIDFWSEYQSDMDSMTMTWITKHFRQFNLKVVDDGGVERSCNCLRKGNIQKSDLVNNEKRMFHTIIIYQIWVELDSETRYNKPMVVNRDIKAEQSSN